MKRDTHDAERYRIRQISPAPPGLLAFFRAEQPGAVFTAPVICLALVEATTERIDRATGEPVWTGVAVEQVEPVLASDCGQYPAVTSSNYLGIGFLEDTDTFVSIAS